MSYDSVFRPGLFQGQTVIVTGGGSGIGRCTAHELSALGARVVLVGRNVGKLDRVAAEVAEDGGAVDTQAFDIRDEGAVRDGIAAILARNGPVSGLVNNAGGQFPAKLEDITANGWNAVVATNLTGGFLVSREVYTQCMRDRGGSMVNIIADMWRSMATMGHSGAARAGMLNLTRTAAVEWAHSGVRVNAVAPGWIASSGLDTYDAEGRAHMKTLRRFPALRRYGTEAEVSAAIVFLLSPAAGFISGSCIRVDGAAPNMPVHLDLPDHDKSRPYEGFHRAELPEVLREEAEGGGDAE
ncbi:MAG: SDR family oxidoreductase [Hyphomicrobiales bacterium]|nr:SDR family oxidoreductase [Hyphomicrobiales bacterium]MCP5374060.1 SDR family oxidoreductase [Hyphomicrobiales bacterium]